MSKAYLITGAAGFIGSAVAAKHISLGHKVYTIDNLSTGVKSNIPDGVHFIEGDCYEPTVIAKLNGLGIKVIYHIAGQSSGEISFENPEYDLNTNTLSTLLLLKFAKEEGVEKFIYASTMSVYGDQSDLPVTECTLTQPKSFYAVGKLASEKYLNIYHSLGVRSTALRLFNVYGPGQNLDNMKQGMASIFMAQALKKCVIEVRGSLERFRDFVYIEDVVDAFLQAECFNMNKFEVFNICSGLSTTVEDLVNLIIKQSTIEIVLRKSDGTPGDQFGVYGSNKKADTLLNWKPNMDMEEGIAKMYDWAKDRV